MGNRLVVKVNIAPQNIFNNSISVCTVYYHWSAYYWDTVKELYGLGGAIQYRLKEYIENGDSDNKYSIQKSIIEYLLRTGGGVDGVELEDESTVDFLRNCLGFEEELKGNRNDGLIAITDGCMRSQEAIAESVAYITINNSDEIQFNFDSYIRSARGFTEEEKDDMGAVLPAELNPRFKNYYSLEDLNKLYTFLKKECVDGNKELVFLEDSKDRYIEVFG